MSMIYLDTETTGLDPARHQVWEIAYAVGDNTPESAFVPHNLVGADKSALEIGGYWQRIEWGDINVWHDDDAAEVLSGATLVGANPAFDAAFLRARWGHAPWHHRLLDIEAYAMGALGHEVPKGLAVIADDLLGLGHEIPEPDHTAAGDVECVRACHLALKEIYEGMRA